MKTKTKKNLVLHTKERETMGFPLGFTEDLAQFLKDSEKVQKEQKQEKNEEGMFQRPIWKGVCLSDTSTGLDLAELLKGAGESFHEMLFRLIDESGMTDVDVYKRAGIDRKLFSKIRSNPACHPRKNTVVALALALKLDLQETEDLLARAEYALSPSNKGDLIIRYCIQHEIYDLMTVNFALEQYGQPILG